MYVLHCTVIHSPVLLIFLKPLISFVKHFQLLCCQRPILMPHCLLQYYPNNIYVWYYNNSSY